MTANLDFGDVKNGIVVRLLLLYFYFCCYCCYCFGDVTPHSCFFVWVWLPALTGMYRWCKITNSLVHTRIDGGSMQWLHAMSAKYWSNGCCNDFHFFYIIILLSFYFVKYLISLINRTLSLYIAIDLLWLYLKITNCYHHTICGNWKNYHKTINERNFFVCVVTIDSPTTFIDKHTAIVIT